MQKEIAMIVAVGIGRQIGLKGDVPWHYKEDLQFFKKTTMGGVLIMGRKTWDSIGIVLPGRKTIVISSTLDKSVFNGDENGFIVKNLEEAIKLTESFQTEGGIFIAGGQKVYEDGQKYASVIHLTKVPYEGAADTYFPELDKDWVKGEDKKVISEKDQHALVFTTYTKPAS